MRRPRRRRFAAQFTFDHFVESVVQYAEEQGIHGYDYDETPLFEFALKQLTGLPITTAEYLELLKSIPTPALREILGEDFVGRVSTVEDALSGIIVHVAVNEAAKHLI